MTNLLITYKGGVDDGVELRYMLRSIERHLHMDDLHITIVGAVPSWWSGIDATHVEWDNSRGDKPRNMHRALLLGAQSIIDRGRVHEPSVYLADDYFLLDHADGITPVYRGSLYLHAKDELRYNPEDWWGPALKSTHDQLVQLGVENPRSWELHRPLPLIPSEVIRTLEPVQDTYTLWRSMYGERADHGRDVYLGYEGRYTGNGFPGGIPWVSTDDAAWSTTFGKRLAAKFERKSRWEQ